MSDVDLKDLLPEPFLTVRPGDQVVVFPDEDVSPDYAKHLKEMLEEWAPEVNWIMVLDTGITGVVHVARSDKKEPEGYVKLKDRLSLTPIGASASHHVGDGMREAGATPEPQLPGVPQAMSEQSPTAPDKRGTQRGP